MDSLARYTGDQLYSDPDRAVRFDFAIRFDAAAELQLLMRLLRRFIPFVLVLIVISVFWVWWNRPSHVDMATYVRQTRYSIFETNSLPQIANGLTHTNSWNVLAGPAGVSPRLGNSGWLSRLAAWLGIGSADTMVFSRMQVAAVVLGVAADDGGETLNVKPRIVIETHSGAGRTLATIEKHVGNFARRAYSDPHVEKKEIEGTNWIVWSSKTSDRRIIAAVAGRA